MEPDDDFPPPGTPCGCCGVDNPIHDVMTWGTTEPIPVCGFCKHVGCDNCR